MGTYIKQHGIYIFIGFAVVFIIGLGVLIAQKFTQTKTPQPQSEINPTSSPQKTEIAFTLEGENSESTSSGCTINPTPIEGNAPATISFVTTITGSKGDNLSFSFVFGDGENQTVERIVTSVDGIERQTISHTYTKAGSYTATTTVSSQNNPTNTTTCKTTISISGVAKDTALTQITNSPILPQTGSGELPTPTKQSVFTPTTKPSPTTKALTQPTVFPTTADDESIPVPQVPTAGGYLPTIIAAVGAIGIIILAFAL